MDKNYKKSKELITIEKDENLRIELIEAHDISKEHVAMTKFVEKNRFKIMNVVGLLRSNFYDLDDALIDAKLSKTSFYRLRQAATIIEDKLEELGIDYEETEFNDLIETVKTLDQSMTNIQKHIKQKILERFDGKFNSYKRIKKGDDGNEYEDEYIVYDKPASATELIKVAEFFDKRKRPENATINIENNSNANAVSTEKLIFEIIDPKYIIENMNNDVFTQTINEIENIENQMKNGDFDE